MLALKVMVAMLLLLVNGSLCVVFLQQPRLLQQPDSPLSSPKRSMGFFEYLARDSERIQIAKLEAETASMQIEADRARDSERIQIAKLEAETASMQIETDRMRIESDSRNRYFNLVGTVLNPLCFLCAIAFLGIKLEHAFTGKMTDIERFFAKLDPTKLAIPVALVVAAITAVQLIVGGLLKSPLRAIELGMQNIAKWLHLP